MSSNLIVVVAYPQKNKNKKCQDKIPIQRETTCFINERAQYISAHTQPLNSSVLEGLKRVHA